MSYEPPMDMTYRRKVYSLPLLYWYLAAHVPAWVWFTIIYPPTGLELDPLLNWILIFELAFAIPTAICLGSLAIIQAITRKERDFGKWKHTLLRRLWTWPLAGGMLSYLVGAVIASNWGSSIAEATPGLVLFLGSLTIFITFLNLLFGLYVIKSERKNHPEYTGLPTTLM